MNYKNMRIILCGGGTIGSVSPLLAIRDEIIKQQSPAEFLWVGTNVGLEKDIMVKEKINYKAIQSGKLRRYFSWQNFIDPFRFIIGYFQSLFIIMKFKPDYILCAGGFVCVPVVWAGWLLRKKSIIHQQDIRTGFANKLMAPFAFKITVAFEASLKHFSAKKTVLIGNPVRSQILSGTKESASKRFGLEGDLPTLFVMGGSLGAEKINELMFESITSLIDHCQIIHATGKGNLVEWQDKEKFGDKAKRYHSYEYLFEELPDAYAAADLVICRAGLSTLTELTALAKPIIVIPIPQHQQVENAVYFANQNAIIQLDQPKLTADELVDMIKNLFDNPNSLSRLSENIKGMLPQGAAEKFVALLA